MTLKEIRDSLITRARSVNRNFTLGRSSLKPIVQEIENQIAVGVPDAGRLCYLIAINQDTRLTKYGSILRLLQRDIWNLTEQHLENATGLEYQNIAYTTMPTNPNATPKIEVKEGRDTRLVFYKGVLCIDGVRRIASPEDLSHMSKTNKEAQYVIQLATQTVKIVRALLRRGTLNNLMDGPHTYRMKVKKPKKWGEGYIDAYENRTGFMSDRSPALLNKKIEDMRTTLSSLHMQNPSDHVKMAAMGLAPRIVGAGVCAMVAHVTLGVLTTIAEGIRVLLVFDSSFDHSYCVVSKGHSRWFSVDPWTRDVYVCPWEDCWFPPQDVRQYYRVDIVKPVVIPYGVNFRQEHITQVNGIMGSGTGAMDSTYSHPSNVHEDKQVNYKTRVVGPTQWGSAQYQSFK